jgi:hypothetical protein
MLNRERVDEFYAGILGIGPSLWFNSIYRGISVLPSLLWEASTLALPTGATFTRAGTGYAKDHLGACWLAAASWPRFCGARIADPDENGELVYYGTDGNGDTIDPATLYLLDEPSATNLVGYSHSVSFWSTNPDPNSCTFLDNAGTSPDGLVTAGKITPAALEGSHTSWRASTISLTSGVTYCRSVYVNKNASQANYVLVYLRGPSTGAVTNGARFNLATGEYVDTVGSLVTGYGSETLSGVWDGWFRFWVAVTPSASAVGNISITPYAELSTATFTGDGTGFLVWGNQIEVGSTPSSQIPTPASTAVTRAADVLNISGVSGYQADNESRLTYTGSANVDVDDWDGIVDAGPSTHGKIRSIRVYRPRQRP